jgi:hypothetical protein
MSERLTGGITLLHQDHFTQDNPWNKPVVGWVPTSQGVGGLMNPMGWAMIRGVLWKRDGTAPAIPLYDQPVIVEKPGAIVIARMGDRIGMVKQRRMTMPRPSMFKRPPNADGVDLQIGDGKWILLTPEQAARMDLRPGEQLVHPGNEYMTMLDEQQLWESLLSMAGEWKWEAPRGLIQGDPGSMDLKEFVLKTAQIEASEEGGFKIVDARLVGTINANPTFFLHPQWVVEAEIESVGDARPENLEIIGGSQMMSMRQLKSANGNREFDDALTLGGMALCGLCL